MPAPAHIVPHNWLPPRVLFFRRRRNEGATGESHHIPLLSGVLITCVLGLMMARFLPATVYNINKTFWFQVDSKQGENTLGSRFLSWNRATSLDGSDRSVLDPQIYHSHTSRAKLYTGLISAVTLSEIALKPTLRVRSTSPLPPGS